MNICLDLFTSFFRIGIFTIGGGYAMIPLIQQTVVEKKQWINDQELTDTIAVAQSCPGIFAVNISIFIGYKLRGSRGALVSAIGTCLPSFLIILLIAMVFRQFQDNKYVVRIFRGMRPAVVALIASPVFKMAKNLSLNRYNIWIPIAGAVLISLFGVNPVYVILVAALGGYAYGQLIKE